MKQEANGECSTDMEQRRREDKSFENAVATLCRRKYNRGSMEQNGVNCFNKNIRTSKETLPILLENPNSGLYFLIGLFRFN